MSDSTRSRLAVLGSPIAHSLSPAIHAAAYEVLGLDWSYEAVDVTGNTLARFVSDRDSTWRGLSLTMPLKREILPLLDSREQQVRVVGAANTVLFGDGGKLHGFNTDVYGVEQSFRNAGIERLALVHILGGGATAASVIAGVVRLGATSVHVSARTPSRAAALVDLGHALGAAVSVTPWGSPLPGVPDAVVSAVPGGEPLPVFSPEIRQTATLFDVAYDPWPSVLATSWEAAGGTVISGLELLVNQAIGQIRIFVSGEQASPLPDEAAVVAAMKAAIDRR